MKRTISIIVAVLMTMGIATAADRPSLSVSAAVKTQVPVVYSLLEEAKPMEPVAGVSFDFQYDFLTADGGLFAGKDLTDSFKVSPFISAGISIPVRRTRIVFARGLDLSDKSVYFRLAFGRTAKSGLYTEFDVICPSAFAFGKRNWTEINHLKQNLSNSSVTLKAGYSFPSSRQDGEKEFYKTNLDWYYGFSQSILFTGFEFLGEKDRLRFSFAGSMPVVYGLGHYVKEHDYLIQISEAPFFSAVRLEMGVSYRLINMSKFKLTAGAKVISLWFNGQYINVPAFFQAYSLAVSSTAEYWLNEKNGFILEAGVPSLNLYFHENESKPRFTTALNDPNTLTVLKYMTKVAYVHKINNK